MGRTRAGRLFWLWRQLHKHAQPPQTGILPVPRRMLHEPVLKRMVEADQVKENDLDVEEIRHYCRTVADGGGLRRCTGAGCDHDQPSGGPYRYARPNGHTDVYG